LRKGGGVTGRFWAFSPPAISVFRFPSGGLFGGPGVAAALSFDGFGPDASSLEAGFSGGVGFFVGADCTAGAVFCAAADSFAVADFLVGWAFLVGAGFPVGACVCALRVVAARFEPGRVGDVERGDEVIFVFGTSGTCDRRSFRASSRGLGGGGGDVPGSGTTILV
jgi:hypothetical protein